MSNPPLLGRNTGKGNRLKPITLPSKSPKRKAKRKPKKKMKLSKQEVLTKFYELNPSMDQSYAQNVLLDDLAKKYPLEAIYNAVIAARKQIQYDFTFKYVEKILNDSNTKRGLWE